MIYEVEIPNAWNLIRSIFYKTSPIDFPGYFLSTATGRSATFHILNYLRKTGIIKDKNSPIIVPKWLCISFLQLIRKHCSPILKHDSSARLAIVFHQYGFPQNMDEIMDYCSRKKIIVIEDCAHLFEGYYKRKRLGTFGLASIFSLSKLFPSIWGGGLATINEDLYNHAKEEQDKMHSRWISLFLHLTKYKTNIKRKKDNKYWNNLNTTAYGCAEYAQKTNIISSKIISHELTKKVLEKRRQNYLFVLDYFKNTDFFYGLEEEGVNPYILPLITDENRLLEIKKVLLQKKISTGIYHFDINRNLFNPIYKKCIWVPVHQGLDPEKMAEICETISSAL